MLGAIFLVLGCCISNSINTFKLQMRTRQQILLHKVMWCNNHAFQMKAQQKFKKTFQCQYPKLSCISCLVLQQCPGTATKCEHSFLGIKRIATLSIPMLSLCFWDEKQSWSIEEFMKPGMSLWSSSEDWEDEEGIVTNVGKIDIFGVRRDFFSGSVPHNFWGQWRFASIILLQAHTSCHDPLNSLPLNAMHGGHEPPLLCCCHQRQRRKKS